MRHLFSSSSSQPGPVPARDLALVLLLIGILLIADGFGVHVPKGYIYFALAFSVAVESLNHWVRRRRKRLKAAA